MSTHLKHVIVALRQLYAACLIVKPAFLRLKLSTIISKHVASKNFEHVIVVLSQLPVACFSFGRPS